MIPFWAPQIAAHRRRSQMYRRLGPLAAAVGVAPPPPGGGLWSRSARLLHRVIHIRDALIGPLRGRLRLDAYQTGYDRGIQEGLSEDEARVVAEATCVAAALRSPPGAGVADEAPPFTLDADLDAEAAWLARVSEAFRAAVEPR